MNPWIYVGLSHNDRYSAVRYFAAKDKTRPDKIAVAVAEAFDVTVDEIKSRARYQTIADARHSMIKLTRQELGMSTTQIGKYINRHHATVLNSLKVFDRFYQCDKLFARRHDAAEQLYKTYLKLTNEEGTETLPSSGDSAH